jgi:3-methyladenine DNA glycosylase/8-oxoguanine DNA glycosylase
VHALGTPVDAVGELRAFPEPVVLADAELADLGMTNRTRQAVRELARLCVETVIFDPGADRAEVRATLLAIRGVGPWTADYIALRAMRDPDILPTGDLIVRRRAEALGLPSDPGALAEHGHRWSPWRTYVTHHLWAAVTAEAPAKPNPTRRTR